MKEPNLNPGGLKWTHTRSSLSAETFGRPAESLEMDCGIGAVKDGVLQWERAKALWDTGTSTTVITPELDAKLGLEPDGDYMDLNGLGGVQKAWTAVVCVGLPNGKAYGPIPVAVHDLPSTDVLIGMDVICTGRFLLEPKPDGGTKFMFIL